MSIALKIASYFWDIPVEKTSSEVNDYLEVVWSQGRKVLNTKSANFSFGNGYKVFEKAISTIKEEVERAAHVLVLGFGCGSILDILKPSIITIINLQALNTIRKLFACLKLILMMGTL